MKRILLITALCCIISLICWFIPTFHAQAELVAETTTTPIETQQAPSGSNAMKLLPHAGSFTKGRSWIIRFHMAEDSNPLYHRYCQRLLGLILNRTVDHYGSYRIESKNTDFKLSESTQEITKNRLDIIIDKCNNTREHSLSPIRIPIFRGLDGYHVFIIQASQQNAFNQIQTLADLQTKRSGLLAEQALAAAYSKSGLPFHLAQDFQTLIQGLIQQPHQQYDYMLQSLFTAYSTETRNILSANTKTLALAEKLCLHYPSSWYFYVGPEQKLLHERIQVGFERCLFDGSFERLFESYFADLLTEAALEQRQVLHIENPDLPSTMPLERDWHYEPHNAMP